MPYTMPRLLRAGYNGGGTHCDWKGCAHSGTTHTCGFPTAHYVLFRWDTFLHDAMYNLHYVLQLFASLIHAFCNMLMAQNSNLTVVFFYRTVCKMHITYSSGETNFCMMQCIICIKYCSCFQAWFMLFVTCWWLQIQIWQLFVFQ